MEIKKLADIIEWADTWIEELKLDSTEKELCGTLTGKYVTEFEAVKKVILESMERHSVYTSDLKNDIASKDAKIEKLEKEIEGRKECYTAIKELMDTKYISIEEHNEIVNSYTDEHNNTVDVLNNEIERLNRYTTNLDKVNHDLVTKVTLLESEIESRKEEVKKLKKCIMEKNESINTGNEAIINLRKQIGAHVEENKKLEKRIEELKETITELSHEIDNYKSWNASLHEDIKSEINNKNDLVDTYEKKYDEFEKKIADLEEKVKHQRENLDGINKTLEIRTKENESLITVRNNQTREIEAHEAENARLSDIIKNLRASNGKFREELAKKNEEIEYYKSQERIRTDQLRATESKVEELYKQIEGLTNNARAKSTEMARLRKEMSDIKHELKKEDDHGREGFEEYIKYIINEEEGKFKEELNKRFSEEVSKISQKRTEEELAKMKGIPCGEDAIE